jgi:Transposase and inactivated derivatives
MTDEMMSLRTLLEKSSDADLLREMVGFAAQRLMELEVESLTGAAHGERSPDRINHRNGYRDRIWETRAGTVELRSQSCARSSYFPVFLEPRRWPRKRSPRLSRRLTCTACRRARSMIWSKHGHDGLSKSQVSRLCSEIDDKIAAFLNRPLEGDWPYLWLDATYVKVRATVALSRSLSSSPSPSTATAGARCWAWRSAPPRPRPSGPSSCARWPGRGLRGVKLVISDAMRG